MTLDQLLDPKFIGDALKQTPKISKDSTQIFIQLKGASFEIRYSVSFDAQFLKIEPAVYVRELEEAATWKPFYTGCDLAEFAGVWGLLIDLACLKNMSVRQAEKDAVIQLVKSYEYER